MKRANDIDRHVAARLRAIRISRGVTQEQLADGLGVTFQQVQKYEKGINRVSAGRLHELSDILAVPITEFYAGLDERGKSAIELPIASRFDLDIMRACAEMNGEQKNAMLRFVRASARSAAEPT